MYRRERPQACLMLFSVPHTGETAAPGTTLCENYASRREQHQERDRAVTRVPTLKGKLQRTEHTTREKISEETKNPPLQTPAGLQTGSPDRTPTSPREADGEFFLLRFSSGKKSWRARRPIFSTCSAGGNTKEQRVRGYWQELLQIGGGGVEFKQRLCSHAKPRSEARSPNNARALPAAGANPAAASQPAAAARVTLPRSHRRAAQPFPLHGVPREPNPAAVPTESPG